MSEKTPEEILCERIEAAKKRSAGVKEGERLPFLQQQAIDLEAKADLEAEHGFERVKAISLERVWVPGSGAPTLVLIRIPKGSEKLGQRFIEQVNRAKEGSKERLQAQDALATECWLYPPKGSDGHKAALEIAPLILSKAAVEIVEASQGQREAEGKD